MLGNVQSLIIRIRNRQEVRVVCVCAYVRMHACLFVSVCIKNLEIRKTNEEPKSDSDIAYTINNVTAITNAKFCSTV